MFHQRVQHLLSSTQRTMSAELLTLVSFLYTSTYVAGGRLQSWWTCDSSQSTSFLTGSSWCQWPTNSLFLEATLSLSLGSPQYKVLIGHVLILMSVCSVLQAAFMCSIHPKISIEWASASTPCCNRRAKIASCLDESDLDVLKKTGFRNAFPSFRDLHAGTFLTLESCLLELTLEPWLREVADVFQSFLLLFWKVDDSWDVEADDRSVQPEADCRAFSFHSDQKILCLLYMIWNQVYVTSHSPGLPKPQQGTFWTSEESL